MRQNAHSPAKILRSILLGAAILAGSSGGFAQQLPQIGLSPTFALLVAEQGPAPHFPAAADHYGSAVAAGDFNGDGYDDLASGIPDHDCNSSALDCGTVQVRFGWEVGALGGFLTLDPAAHPVDPAEALERYGSALAAGDFNHDNYADLAVGVPGNDGLGAVQIHYGAHGSLGSIQAVAGQILKTGAPGFPVPPAGQHDLRLGAALAVGDFNGDGYSDLAAGDPSYWASGVGVFGRVFIAHGHADFGEGAGLVPYDGFEIEQGIYDIGDSAEHADEFGAALATGDFNGDGYDDLAIGVPNEDGAGAINVVYGSPFSLILLGTDGWVPDPFFFGHLDLGLAPQAASRFGAVLAAGDFNRDGYDDLAASAPNYDGGDTPRGDVGTVSVLYGSAAGLSAGAVSWLWEDQIYGAGNSEAFDEFGSALAAGDFNADGSDDLAVGARYENLSDIDSGAVTVILGRPNQILFGVSRRLYAKSEAPLRSHAGMIPDFQAAAPFYGSALATGDFDGNGFADLAIGAPGRNAGSADVGAVAVLFGQLFVDGFEGGDAREWSGVAP
jgi:hypothetical protein